MCNRLPKKYAVWGIMASITKMGNGKWRAQVYRGGVRKSKVLPSKKQAQHWAAEQEWRLENVSEVNSRIPFGDLLDRYGKEVSSHKKGWRSEIVRIDRIRREPIAQIAIGDLATADFADWRDMRLRRVKGASVRRELEQMSAVLKRARSEWGLMDHNPLDGLARPKSSAPRNRLPTDKEIEALRLSAGEDLNNKTARVFHAWLFAIETGMRAGEIAGLRSEHVTGRVARLPETKNGTARDVPLSKEALRLLGELPDFDPVFGLTSDQISALWRKLRDRANIKNLTFHDSRHCAVTRLSKKLDVLDLARMIGHRDIRMLMIYYETTADELAGRLD